MTSKTLLEITDSIETALTNLMDRWADEYRYEKKMLPEYGKALQQSFPADIKIIKTEAFGKNKLRFAYKKGDQVELVAVVRKADTQSIYIAACTIA